MHQTSHRNIKIPLAMAMVILSQSFLFFVFGCQECKKRRRKKGSIDDHFEKVFIEKRWIIIMSGLSRVDPPN